MRKSILIAALAVGLSGPAPAGHIYESSGKLIDMPNGRFPPCMLARPQPGATEPPCVQPKLGEDAPAPERIARLLARAEGFMVVGSQAPAEREIQEALTLDPRSVAALHMSARFHLTLGDTVKARQRMSEALALETKDANLWITSAEIHESSTEALADLVQALTLRPDYVPALLARIYLHQTVRDRAAAEADLASLARIAPQHRVVRKWRLDKAIAEGRFEDAIEELTSRLADAPRDFSLLVRRATLAQATGNHALALADYDAVLGEGIQTTPRYAVGAVLGGPLYFSRAHTLAALGRREDARRDVEKALELADQRLTLKIQLHLRRRGFEGLAVNGRKSPELTDAALDCIANPACGQGLVGPT